MLISCDDIVEDMELLGVAIMVYIASRIWIGS
jgi:hypothetical protein